MKKSGIIIFLFVFSFCLISDVQAQGLLKKLKNKVEDKLEEKVDDKVDEALGGEDSNNRSGNENSSSKTRPGNTRGEGLIVEPPDVQENIKSGETAYQDKKFSDARFSIRQAIIGVEMEIGKNILQSLPEKVNELQYNEEEDKVTSTGIGFVGLTIERSYLQDEQQLDVTVANNSAWLASINTYLSNSGYASSSTDQQYKSVNVQDHRGVLEFDDYSGYKLSIPIGQSSLIIFEGVNFKNEPELMAAANQFNISEIKTKLGEQ